MINKPIYVADFETTADSVAKEEGKTSVWLWGLTSIDDIDRPVTGTDIRTFFLRVANLENAIIYFHNLKFDGSFILSELLKQGYEYDSSRKPSIGCYNHIITEVGVWYNIKVNFNGNIVEFRDSSKKIPGTVERIGKSFKTKYQKSSLDFGVIRGADHIPTREELEYVKLDTQVIAEVIKYLKDQRLTKLTIGSDCLEEYKRSTFRKEELFRAFFPEISKEEDEFVRGGYRGGWCYVNPKYQGRELNQVGNTYDVNSLYPSMMSSEKYMIGDVEYQNYFPCGNGIWFDGEPTMDEEFPLWIVKFKASFDIKEGMLPFIQLKNNSRYMVNEHITSTNGEKETMTLCNVDFQLFYEHYDIHEIEFIGGYKYMAKIGFFDGFIQKWMKVKVESTGAMRELAKLMLNNLYGKFVTNVKNRVKVSYLDENGVIKFKAEDLEDKDAVYAPVGIFTTAWARNYTIRHAQMNYDNFCYADTDSIHLIGEPVGLVTHDSNLCSWKHESTWDNAIFIRQKTYLENVRTKEGNEWVLTGCGMQKKTKARIIEMIINKEIEIEDIKPGFRVVGTQLKPKQVQGGVILYDGDFVLH